jgi:enoyl-CoA hydratase/carnithine racemase
VGADEAVRLGLAQLAVPVGELEEAARDLADALLEAPDTALRELKPLLRKAIDAIPEDQWRHEREAQARLLAGLGWDTAGQATH